MTTQEISNKKKVENWIFNVYIATWNVSTRYPDSIAIHTLLGLNSSPQKDENLPDFYIIGLQEVNAQVQNVVINMFKEDPWTQKFKEILRIRDYVIIKTEQMQGLLLIVFARKRHLLHVREVEAEYTRTGLGGMWGNKGAVSIRMNLYGTSVVFVNAHLAAHDHMLDERVDDYNKIIEEHKYHVKVAQNILQHDYVFWFGDLNFRLTGEATTTPEEIRDMIHNDKLGTLIERDQLKLVMNQKRAFHELVERPPAFPPTFKFEPGTNDYDMKRRPAWCDRVLYKVGDKTYKNVKLQLDQTSYKSHPNYLLSDHKPVTSEFTIRIEKLPSVIKRDAFDAGQVFSDPTEEVVMFEPVEGWQLGEDFAIKYSVPFVIEDQGSDWVGIYRHDFTSLEQYVAYEYTSKSKAVGVTNTKERPGKIFSLTFPDTLDLPEDENEYRLLYFQSTGTKGVTSMVGMSEAFRVQQKAPPTPPLDSLD